MFTIVIQKPVLKHFSMESGNICFVGQLPLTNSEMEIVCNKFIE